MPVTDVKIFQRSPGKSPLIDWLDEQPPKVQDKCYDRITRLKAVGHEMRRPLADFLEREIYELRVEKGGVNYRILYAFVGKDAVLLSHGCTKTKKVPPMEIERAITNLKDYRGDRRAHTYELGS